MTLAKKTADSKRTDPALWPLAWVINSDGEAWPLKSMRAAEEIKPQSINATAGVDVPRSDEVAKP